MINFDIISIIILLGISQGLFMAVYFLLIKKGNKYANRIMGFLIINYCICVFYGVLVNSNLYLKLPHLLRTGIPFQLYLYPFLYLRSFQLYHTITKC